MGNFLESVQVIKEHRDVPVSRVFDIIVAGGGMSGCSAAIAAARSGAKTLLVERYGFLGGTATAAMVSSFCGLYTCGPDSTLQQLIYGQAEELTAELERIGAGFQLKHRFHFDISMLQLILDNMLLEAGVELLFQSSVTGAVMEDNRIIGVLVENKSGRSAVKADMVIDASGDGDVAISAGAPWEKGDHEGRLQAPTYVFYVGGVDIERAMSLSEEELRDMQEALRQQGEFKFTRVSGSYSPATKPGVMHVNMTRVHNVDGTDSQSLTRGHLEGRKQIMHYFTFLKERVSGFENAYIDTIAPQLGIRETRRITGEYQLTREDVLGAKKFEDAVCRSSWPIEDHTIGLDTVRLHLPGDDYYQVPYRVLVPKEVENLLVTGRCISATHDALASVRVMGPGMALGQAAGTAVALALDKNTSPRSIPIEELQNRLIQAGVIL